MIKKYKTATDFRIALLEIFKNISKKDKIDIVRLQRQVAYDRFLCRLFSEASPPWILKGGHVMELRLQNSRATKDLDLGLKDLKLFSPQSIEDQSNVIFHRISELASLDLKDYFNFIVYRPILDLTGPPYGGARYPVEAKIDGKKFVQFNIDVGVGDIWIEPHEKIKLRDWLDFAGITTLSIPVISKEQHFAEKIHAYSLPRESAYNSRTKDLVDLVLLVNSDDINTSKLKHAINETFNRRKTHSVPEALSQAPANWEVKHSTA